MALRTDQQTIFVILRSPMCGRYTITTEIRHNYCHYVTLSGIDFDIDVLAEREKQMASEPKRVRASDAG